MGIARIKRCYKAGLGTKTFLILWVAKLKKAVCKKLVSLSLEIPPTSALGWAFIWHIRRDGANPCRIPDRDLYYFLHKSNIIAPPTACDTSARLWLHARSRIREGHLLNPADSSVGRFLLALPGLRSSRAGWCNWLILFSCLWTFLLLNY